MVHGDSVAKLLNKIVEAFTAAGLEVGFVLLQGAFLRKCCNNENRWVVVYPHLGHVYDTGSCVIRDRTRRAGYT